MTNDCDPKDPTREELEADIQQLRQELARLQELARVKDELYAQENTTKDLTATRENGIYHGNDEDHSNKKNAWLIETIKHLLNEHNSTSISHTLGELAQHFNLCNCSLWRWDHRRSHLESWGRWQGIALTDEHTAAWIEDFIRVSPATQPKIQTWVAPHLPAFFSENGIAQTLLVPVQRNHHSEGFMTLHCAREQSWSAQDLERITVLADLFFSVQDRQQLLRTLADRDTRFQYAMEASRDGLWDWNIVTGEMYFSRSYLRMLGYRYGELPGNLQTLRDHLLHPEDSDRVLAQYLAGVENHRPNLNLEFRMLHQNGNVVWVYSRAKFVEPDAEGRPRRCVGINADISDFIRSQEELLSAKTQADMANKTKGEFLARMSHEIRTPMNAIIGLGHLLHDTALDDQQRSYLGSMNTAAESLLHIINQVLDFSKIETGKIMLENTHFDLDQVFEKLSRLYEISALHRAVDIVYDIRSNVPRFLRGDASRLSQIISHLITNALQYSTTNQVVVGVKTVKQNSKQVTLEFTITDFGIGMSEEQLAQLQTALLKGSNESSGKAGFGLNICNHLVSLMEGRININSKPGEGCKIGFTARFENSHIGSKSVHDQPHILSKLRALIVDDNTIARNIIASTTHSIRMHADTTDSASNALEKIRNADAAGKPYHLVLMDYKMPLLDGLQATAMIKSDQTLNATPLVFLISSYHRDEIFNGSENAALVDGFLSKPVSESRLFDTISQAIDKDHPLRELMTADSDESTDDDLLLTNLRVLLAEDNLVNQQVACGILKKKNIQVTLANNGREAVELLQANRDAFDMILMDLEMPELDGYQATQIIRTGAVNPRLPIIAITAQAMRGDRERCLAAGMDAYLTKPIMPDMLYRTLADMVRRHAATNHKSPL